MRRSLFCFIIFVIFFGISAQADQSLQGVKIFFEGDDGGATANCDLDGKSISVDSKNVCEVKMYCSTEQSALTVFGRVYSYYRLSRTFVCSDCEAMLDCLSQLELNQNFVRYRGGGGMPEKFEIRRGKKAQ